jgi:hypothetical protein
VSGPESWREEKQSAWLYRELAACEPDPRIAGLGDMTDSEMFALWKVKDTIFAAPGETVYIAADDQQADPGDDYPMGEEELPTP